MMLYSKFFKTAAFLSLMGMAHVYAQSVVATVNGAAIPAALLEQIVKNNANQDVKDTPELRQVIRNELIVRELLTLRHNYLAELLLADHLKKNPISDEDVRKEYERQSKELTGAQQYKISDIALANEADAKVAQARLKKGERFEVVARDMSIDGSKDKGGDLGWLLAEQIVPLISNVVVNLPKGTTAAAPIQTPTGWHLIRLDDKRPYTIPRFEEAKEVIRQGLLQQKRANFINQIQAQAKIVTPS
jgi:peptidyl-prolyl cis-trans isomerase C